MKRVRLDEEHKAILGPFSNDMLNGLEGTGVLEVILRYIVLLVTHKLLDGHKSCCSTNCCGCR